MTGPEHYREAEHCIKQGCRSDENGEHADALVWIRLGHVHATLALAAATALNSNGRMRWNDGDAWDDTAGTPWKPEVPS